MVALSTPHADADRNAPECTFSLKLRFRSCRSESVPARAQKAIIRSQFVQQQYWSPLHESPSYIAQQHSSTRSTHAFHALAYTEQKQCKRLQGSVQRRGGGGPIAYMCTSIYFTTALYNTAALMHRTAVLTACHR